MYPNGLTEKLSQLLKNRPTPYQLKQIHAQAIARALPFGSKLAESLLRSYLSAKNLNYAKFLFNSYPSPSPPTLLWNLMIRAFSKIDNCHDAISFFGRMLAIDGPMRVAPDKYTFTFTITSCSHQATAVHGEIVHGLAFKNGFDCDLYVGNSLINLYSIFGKLEDAHKVFDQMPERDVFSWTSLVCGYAKHGEMCRASDAFDKMPERNEVSWTVMISGFVGGEKYIEALRYFHDMLCDDALKPNEAVLVCVLSACAHLGALDQGIWIHGYIGRSGISDTSNISTALIDMYAKCGRIDSATRIFNRLFKRDVLTYTSMISGLSIHGLGKDALQVFTQMLADKFEPNEITLLATLKGCSHSGLVEEGTSIFYNMESLWGILPSIAHYGCYIDLLGRAGHLERAYEVVKNMPMEPDIIIWRALVSACRIYRDANLGERAVEHVEQLGSRSQSGGEVLLSNMFAALGQWEKVASVRELMSEKRNDSSPGCSWIEIKGVVHEFRVADRMHPQIEDIRNQLIEILEKARAAGYRAQTTEVSFELCEEEKEQALAWHSEKLAVAFALMSTEPGTLIRIVKNLRTCDDCHSALKAISQVYGREIVVRDCSRFHTFKHGNCSCNDFW